jgi:hypothetical protein
MAMELQGGKRGAVQSAYFAVSCEWSLVVYLV